MCGYVTVLGHACFKNVRKNIYVVMECSVGNNFLEREESAGNGF